MSVGWMLTSDPARRGFSRDEWLVYIAARRAGLEIVRATHSDPPIPRASQSVQGARKHTPTKHFPCQTRLKA